MEANDFFTFHNVSGSCSENNGTETIFIKAVSAQQRIGHCGLY